MRKNLEASGAVQGNSKYTKAAAYHEAAHAVARHWVGAPLTAVEIYGDGTGMCHGTGRYWESHGHGHHAVWDHVLVTLAGAWVEARANKKCRLVTLLRNGDDFGDANGYLKQLVTLGYADSMRAAWARAEEDLTDFFEECCAGVERVAAELLSRKSLSPGEVGLLVNDVGRLYTR